MSSTLAAARPTWAEQAERDRTQEELTRKRRKARERRAALIRGLQNIVSVGGLLILAALSHGGVFGDASGYIAAIGGVVVGMLVALAAARFRLGWFLTALSVFAAYLLTGGPLALSSTTTAFVIPSLKTLQMLVLGVVTSWKDLLTVQPPVGSFVGPAIMPFASGVICAAIAMTIIARTKRPLWALAPVGLLLALGILWGSQSAPLAQPIGVALAVGSLAWAALVMKQLRGEGGRGTVEFANSSKVSARRTMIGATGLIAIGAVVAFVVAPMLTSGGHRSVLRDAIEPPLDLQQFHSPITQFRWLTTDAKDTELFTVEDLPKGNRVRLATLDMYDGTVFKIAGDAKGADFRRVGEEFTDTPLLAGETTNSLSITIGDYSNYWIPGGGEIRSLAYSGTDKQDLAKVLYYSENLGTALSTRRLQQGDQYAVVTVAERPWTDSELEGKAILNLPVPQDSNVPMVIRDVVAKLVGDASPGIEQVRAIQQRLHEDGYYSDGTDGLSLAGHRSDRLEKFLGDDQMIGNDDQYAVAMALMLRAQGIPSRVVMGFYPDDDASGSVTIKGHDTHAWVEVPFESAGWVAFDPTPPEDQTPQTDIPKPKPNPRPQVLQPPDPPEDPAEVPPLILDDTEDDKENDSQLWAMLLLILKIIGLVGLIASPFLLIIGAKVLRANRRRTNGTEDMRTAAAWDQVVDSATDLGVTVPIAATRCEQARRIDGEIERAKATDEANVESSPAAALASELRFCRFDAELSPILTMATKLDGEVFGEGELTEDSRQRAWDEGDMVIKALRKRVSWHRRFRAIFSTRSLRARRTKLSKHIVSLTSSLKPQVEEEALVFTFGGATAAADASPGTGDAAEDNKKSSGRSAKASPVKRRGRRILKKRTGLPASKDASATSGTNDSVTGSEGDTNG